tara:strand:- start:11985 stop:13025 length:1041 start_codon:yes stop_codon:yes gene_type:complete
MTKNYQAVFVTHLPSFYKINLYNALAESLDIFVIFIGESSSLRASDFTQQQKNFDFIILNHLNFEKRNKLSSCLAAVKLLRKIKFNKLILGGWDLPEYWLFSLLCLKKKNCLALESSIYESQDRGVKKTIKSMFLKRISTIFYSGTPHLQLIENLGFQGQALKTLGVGLTHYQPRQQIDAGLKGRFLYVGRLSEEKNLKFLLDAFRKLPDYRLTLIGDGPQRAKLMQDIPNNVQILGHIPHVELAQYYQKHDVFILPSIREPWGLVIEEALYYHLPIIASDRVGASIDLVLNPQTGVLFDPMDEASFLEAMIEMTKNYQLFYNNAQNFDFELRDQSQVQSYLEALQ